MTLADRYQWAQAFMLQAQLDLDLANSLYGIVKSRDADQYLGSRPDLYLPAIYAYCQQSIEKSLKAWLWYASGTIPRKHNPLDGLLRSQQMRLPNRPHHLDVLDRNKRPIGRILDMAPGGGLNRPSMEGLLGQSNTEYPFRADNGDIRLPCQEISESDTAAALKIAKPLVVATAKSLAVVGLALTISDL